MPQISVIVPVYKVEPYLHRCVDSILAQTFTDFELILVDDGSPDNCGVICDEYAQKDSRVVVIHQANGGLSAARNAGIDWAFANSDSEWLFFVDSDDWIHPKSLEALMAGVLQTGCSVVIGSFENTKGESPLVDENALSAVVWDVSAYFREYTVNAIVAWGKLYQKESFRSIRYPVGKIHEDDFTTHQIMFSFEKIAFVEQPIYAYFQNELGIMRTQTTKDILVVFSARAERIRYFRNHGRQEMCEWQLREYFLTLYHFQAHLLLKKSDDESLVRIVMRNSIQEFSKEMRGVFNRYDLFSFFLMGTSFRCLRQYVVQNDFEPIQNMIRRIKRLVNMY